VLFGMVLRLWSDGAIARRLRGRRLSLSDYAVTVLKDLLSLGVWLTGAFKRTVDWRGCSMRIGPGSRLYPLEQRATHAPELERA
jgi:hypothetical protein